MAIFEEGGGQGLVELVYMLLIGIGPQTYVPHHFIPKLVMFFYNCLQVLQFKYAINFDTSDACKWTMTENDRILHVYQNLTDVHYVRLINLKTCQVQKYRAFKICFRFLAVFHNEAHKIRANCIYLRWFDQISCSLRSVNHYNPHICGSFCLRFLAPMVLEICSSQM